MMIGTPLHRSRLLSVIIGISALIASLGLPPVAFADSTEDFPIPRRIIRTTCTAEQIMAATRDTSPIYYERYMIDYNHHSPQVQQATQDQMHWFFSLTPAQRRDYAEELVNHFADPLTVAWPNHAKLFFNNKGVVAKATAVCDQYPPDDMSVWDW